MIRGSGAGGIAAQSGARGASVAASGTSGTSGTGDAGAEAGLPNTAGAGANALSGGSGGSSGVPSGGADSSMGGTSTTAPTGLLTELLNHPELTAITDATPELSWIVNSTQAGDKQTAYRVLVATSADGLATDTGDLWDSGKVASANSVNVTYAGKVLAAAGSYFWKVQTWDATDHASPWSATQKFVMASSVGSYSTATEPTAIERLPPSQLLQLGTGHYFIDFGRAAFGWLELSLDAANAGASVEVDLGEKAKGQAVDSAPGASIRYAKVSVTLKQGKNTYRVQTPADSTNTSSPAIPLPASIGVVMPFRYVEVVNSPVALTTDMIRQVAVHYPVDNTASTFKSSDATLNQVADISRYSVIATTFTGLYIDGDRERTPYEADAYIQGLGHYGVDREFALARHSHEYLLSHPTWPTEWKQHSVMMAWTDWMYTGDTESLAQAYSVLIKEKTLESYAGSDGLLNTHGLRDIVDWPEGERDGYVLTDENTVVNSFWVHNLQEMVDIATALGKTSDATRYQGLATTALSAFNAKFFNAATGLYVDGATTSHSSLHANMFPLAFGLVPANHKQSVVTFVKSRGMACSVYGAQYLLEGLYQAGEADAALSLMTATTDRSWTNMLKVGSTITLEAWDTKYKPNLDWNHAWGAAPANILPRFLIGVQPLLPGFAKVQIRPQLGSLSHAEAIVPTIRGPISVACDHPAGAPFTMSFTIPANMTANVALPSPCSPFLDNAAGQVVSRDGLSFVDAVGSGQHQLRCQ